MLTAVQERQSVLASIQGFLSAGGSRKMKVCTPSTCRTPKKAFPHFFSDGRRGRIEFSPVAVPQRAHLWRLHHNSSSVEG